MNETVTTVPSRAVTTLDDFRAGRPLVLDFWNTRCVKCPSALSKMDSLASKASASVTFVACALSLGSQSSIQQVEDLIEEFPNLEHVYMDFDTNMQEKVYIKSYQNKLGILYENLYKNLHMMLCGIYNEVGIAIRTMI